MTVPFLIWTTQRTGSTVFWRDLDQHPRVEGHGEMFLEGLDREDSYHAYTQSVAPAEPSVDDYLARLFAARDDVDAIGFKLMYNHCFPAFDAWLAARPDVRMVHLIRDNALKQHVSHLAAEKRGVFHVAPDGERPSTKVTVPVEDLVGTLERLVGRVENARAVLVGRPSIEVHYEDLVARRDATYARVFEFLGVDAFTPAASLKKINPDALNEIVENYDDVVRVLRGTRFESMLG